LAVSDLPLDTGRCPEQHGLEEVPKLKKKYGAGMRKKERLSLAKGNSIG
jgi:hypothetical protein